jgi:hypothetical protein
MRDVHDRAWRWLVAALACASWLGTLVFALFALSPERDIVMPFNSDQAISVIMANERRLTPFHLFYFGQDRFGAWPHLALGAASRLSGPVTPAAFSHAQVIWAWLGAIPLWRLAGVYAPGVLWGYLFALAVDRSLAATLFSFQPYTWQLAALLWAWWGLRELASRGRSRAAPVALAFVASLLAVWMSRASVPTLLGIAAIETWWVPRARRRFGAADVLPLAIAAFATIGESAIRAIHDRYARAHFGADFRTPMYIDSGHLLDNLVSALRTLARMPPAGLTAGLLAAGLAALVICAMRRVRRHEAANWEGAAILAATVSLVGASQIAIAVATPWVRMNRFDARYFALCSVCAFLIAGTLVSAICRAATSNASLVVLAGGMLAFFVMRPAVHPAPEFLSLRGAGLALGQAHPGALVMGDYWSTYALAGAAPEAGLRPVPFEGEIDRMPWLDADLLAADAVFAPLRDGGRLRRVGDPAPLFLDRGGVFELDRTFFAGTWPFARYRVRTNDPASHSPSSR